MKKKNVFLSLWLIIAIFFTFSFQSIHNTNAEPTSEISILLLLDDAFGSNYNIIINEFNQYGWSITTADPSKTISGCQYNEVDFEVDMLFSEITNITDYDCVNIMPGSSHVNMMANNGNILNKINAANASEVILSAWCRAVRVLAAADVVSGRNITGHSDYAAEYAAAGANFYTDSPPKICENLVTVSTTQLYIYEMFKAITQAVGCYEPNPPELLSTNVVTYDNLSRQLSVVLTDDSGILEVTAKLNLISDKSDSGPPTTVTITLDDPDNDNNYSVLIYYDAYGSYSVDITVTDIYRNSQTLEAVLILDVGPIQSAPINVLYTILALITCGTIFILKRKR